MPAPYHRASHIKAVTIKVSHAWAKDEVGLTVGPRSDGRWKQLRTMIQSVVDEVAKRLANRVPPIALDCSVSRLRARHGGWILGSLVERLSETDIYIADLSNDTADGLNPNVLLEAGMAIAMGFGRIGNMYLLIPRDLREPSDLHGLLLTEYTSVDEEMQITDLQGFRAALRSSIYSVAQEKGLIHLSDEGDPEDDPMPEPPTHRD